MGLVCQLGGWFTGSMPVQGGEPHNFRQLEIEFIDRFTREPVHGSSVHEPVQGGEPPKALSHKASGFRGSHPRQIPSSICLAVQFTHDSI